MYGRNIALGPYLIGYSNINVPSGRDLLAHQIGWSPLQWGSQWLAGVRIRLFVGHQFQAYTVVSGTLSQRAKVRYELP